MHILLSLHKYNIYLYLYFKNNIVINTLEERGLLLMAYKKKIENGTLGYIAPVDVIKSGLGDKIDEYFDLRNSDGKIQIGRSSKIQKGLTNAIALKYAEKEKELKELKNQLSEDIDDDDFEDIVKKKKKKDKKKKKKKDKNKDSFYESLTGAVPDDMADYMNGKKKKKKDKDKKKKKKLKGLIIKEKKPKVDASGQPKKPDGKSEVAQRFKEVEKITRENIAEIDETLGVVNERIKEIMKSSDRVRGRDTALANYIEAKTTLISTRQKAATDILSNRAKVYDIEMKKEKNATSSAASDSEIIARLFPGIAINGNMEAALRKHIDESGNNKDGKKKKKDKKKKAGGGYDYGDDSDLLKKREKELIESGDLEYSDYDKHIEYEGRFDVAIKKAFTTGEWKFIAVDKNGSILDIPKSMLPSKKATQMKFDDEKDVAIDMNTNQAYRVYSVPSF